METPHRHNGSEQGPEPSSGAPLDSDASRHELATRNAEADMAILDPELKEILDEFERGFAWGTKQAEEREQELNGGPDSVYPPPLRIGGWVDVDPVLFSGDVDALQPPEDFQPSSPAPSSDDKKSR